MEDGESDELSDEVGDEAGVEYDFGQENKDNSFGAEDEEAKAAVDLFGHPTDANGKPRRKLTLDNRDRDAEV